MNSKESNIYKQDKVFIKEGSNVCWLQGIGNLVKLLTTLGPHRDYWRSAPQPCVQHMAIFLQKYQLVSQYLKEKGGVGIS